MGLSGLVLVMLCVLPTVFAGGRRPTAGDNYNVVTRTGNRVNAQTDDCVSIKILMDDMQSDWHDLNNWGNDFKRGATDEYKIFSYREGNINGFMLRVNNCKTLGITPYRSEPNWFVKWVKVSNVARPTDHLTCYFGEWISANDYSICLSENVEVWRKRLTAEGDFKGPRRIKAIRAGGEMFAEAGYKDQCYYWKGDKVEMEVENFEYCRKNAKKLVSKDPEVTEAPETTDV